jgi:hypothetical protein
VSEPAGAVATWRGVPWWLRAVVLVVAAVLVVELASSLAGARTAPTSPASPFSTAAPGTQAFVALLARVSHHVTVATTPLAVRRVPPDATLLVLDPRRWGAADRAVARATAAAGGRVVFVGAAPVAPGPALPVGTSVAWRHAPVGPVVATARARVAYGVTALITGTGALDVSGDARTVVRGAGGAFVATAGPVTWVGSSAPFQNRSLALLDDAALAWNLVAPFGRPVVVDAAAMAPPPTASGLRALPPWWFAALAVVALAVAAWLMSAARRFGPLEPRARVLPPARTGHAVALGALLEAGRDRAADVAAPVAAAARAALLRDLALAADAPTPAVVEAAAARDVPPWVRDAALRVPTTRAEAVEAGRALAWLAKEEAGP